MSVINSIKQNRLAQKLYFAGTYPKFYVRYLKDYCKFKILSAGMTEFEINWWNRYPCLYDNTKNTSFDTHYIYHPAWAARILAKTNPSCHIDISSTLNFCTIASAFIPIKFYDYRPANISLSNLSSDHANLLSLQFASNSIESLSCMHTVEHIGLGRYGDSLDQNGDLKAISELKRVLAVEGNLLFVVPIGGKPRIQFNAHRIYAYQQIIQYFNDFELMEFTLIPDFPSSDGIILDATEEMANKCTYGCGCFWFKKKNDPKIGDINDVSRNI